MAAFSVVFSLNSLAIIDSRAAAPMTGSGFLVGRDAVMRTTLDPGCTWSVYLPSTILPPAGVLLLSTSSKRISPSLSGLLSIRTVPDTLASEMPRHPAAQKASSPPAPRRTIAGRHFFMARLRAVRSFSGDHFAARSSAHAQPHGRHDRVRDKPHGAVGHGGVDAARVLAADQ